MESFRSVVTSLQEEDFLRILIAGYLDDQGSIAASFDKEEDLWIINAEKSALKPVQCLEYLGLIMDTVQARVFLPPRVKALKDQV